MKLFDDEEIIYSSANEKFILTNYRIRKEHKSFFGSEIKSMLLSDLIGSELKTLIPWNKLRKATIAPILINGIMFIINQYLFKSALLVFFFDEIKIESGTLLIIFFISVAISLYYIFMFFYSTRKVIVFHSAGLSIDLELNWLGFDERESFISKVEQAKVRRK